MEENAQHTVTPPEVHHGNKDCPKAKKAILESALSEFAANGFIGAKMRNIAQGANVNHAMIKYYFNKKDDLWKEAVNLMFDRYDEAMAFSDEEQDLLLSDPKAYIKLYAERYIRYCAAHPDHVRLMIQESIRLSPRLEWICKEHVRRHHKNASAVIRILHEEECLPTVSPLALAYILAGSFQYMYAMAPVVQQTWGIDLSSEQCIQEHIETMFAFLFPDDSKPFGKAG